MVEGPAPDGNPGVGVGGPGAQSSEFFFPHGVQERDSREKPPARARVCPASGARGLQSDFSACAMDPLRTEDQILM